MPVPPSPPLDETIVPGQFNHIGDHEQIAQALNAPTTADSTSLIPDYGTAAPADVQTLVTRVMQTQVDVRSYASLQSAISDKGSAVYNVPPGVQSIASSLVISGLRGVRLKGAGKYLTILRPTSALGANPTVQAVDHRDTTIEGMTIEGFDSGTPACVHSYRSSASPPYNSRGMTLRDVRLGADSSSNAQLGFRSSAAGGADSNNDCHVLDNVEFGNMSVAGISFEHYNSLLHQIIAPRFATMPIAIRTSAAGGGSCDVFGGVYEGITDVLFDLKGTVETTHPFTIHGGHSEGCAKLVRTSTGAVVMEMLGFGMYGATTGVDVINWAAPAGSVGGGFTMIGGWILSGQAATTLRFSDALSRAKFVGVKLGITDIVYNGNLSLIDNTQISVITYTPGASATLNAGGDSAGAYKYGRFTRTAASGDVALAAGVTNDANDRFTVAGSGVLSWGPGSGGVDVSLLRNAAGEFAMKALGSNIGYFEIDNSSAAAETGLIVRQNGVNKWRMKVAAGATNLTFADDSNTDRVTLTNQGNVGVNGMTSFGNGQGVIAIADRAAAPNINPSGGGRLYSESGALKWQGSSGTVTTVAPA